MRIYLDMDGVLVQCHYAALEYYGVKLDTWPEGRWVQQILIDHGITEVEGLSRTEFWATFDENFWVRLQKTAVCDHLIQLCAKYVGTKNVFIASLPSKNPGCWSGKYTWILENLPEWIHEQVILIQGGKDALSQQGHLLIDDSLHNITTFQDAGGVGILVPRPWNGHEHNEEVILHVLPGMLMEAEMARRRR